MKKSEKTLLIVSGGALLSYMLFLRKNLWVISDKTKKWLSSDSEQWVKHWCDKYNVPAGIVGAIILVESWDDPTANGMFGERGLMQITEGAFNEVNEYYQLNYTFDELFVKQLNILTGTLYLKILHDRYKLSWTNAIKAYNVGTDLKPESSATIYFNKVWKYL